MSSLRFVNGVSANRTAKSPPISHRLKNFIVFFRLCQSSLPIYAADVQEARTDKFIGGQWAVIGVEAVRGDEDVRIAARTVRRHDDRRMLPAGAVERELHDIARPDALR